MYKCAVDEGRVKKSLADDPAFLASLSDLDRGMVSESVAPEQPPALPAYRAVERLPARPAAERPTPPIIEPLPRRAPGRRVPLPPSILSPFDALTAGDPAPPDQEPLPSQPASTPTASELPRLTTQPGSRRSLMDLFPPTMTEGEATLPLPVRQAEMAPQPAVTPAPPADVPSAPALATHQVYEAFYGFHEAPFALSTDPRFFYHSTPHDRVCQQLLTAIRKREGLVVLTGEIGAGKTTLCRTVIEQLDRRTLTSLVTDPFVTGEDLLKTILTDFGVLSRDELARESQATRHELSTTLISFVESLASLQASAIVIVDEAQNLPPDVMEQVRILAEAAEASASLQVVLVGQPPLEALLRRRELKGLHQRVTVRCRLEPLPADEIDGYVIHRLAVAGSGPRLEFDGPALERIYRLSQGVPRVVNLIGDRALARGAEASASVIDEALVDLAAEDLDLGEPRSLVRGLAERAAAVAVLALCMIVGGGLAAWMFRDAFARAIAQWRIP